MNKLNNLGIGLTGFAGTEFVDAAAQVSTLPVSDVIKALTQAIIAIATLVSLFRKKKTV